MRKYFIDNIRILCIFLLFPYHTCMIYNNWGEKHYAMERFKTMNSTDFWYCTDCSGVKSFVVTVLCYEILKRFRLTTFLLGIQYRK